MKPPATLFVEAVETQLQEISVANGYITDIGANLRRGFFAQVMNIRDETFPMAVLHPPVESLQSAHGGGKKAIIEVTIPIVIGVRAEPGADTFDLIQQCVFDVRRCLMLNRDVLAQIGQGDTFAVSGSEPDISRDLRLILAAMTASLSIVETY